MAKRSNGEGCWSATTIHGTLYQRYREPGGKSFYGKTKTEAKNKYKAWVESNKEKTKQKITMYDIAQEWLQAKKMRVKDSTYDGYEYFVEHTLKDEHKVAIWYATPDLMTKNRIQLWIDSLADNCPKSTITKSKGLLSQVIDYAVENGYMKFNPMANKAIKMPSEQHIVKKPKEHVFLSTEDRQKLENEELKVRGDRYVHYGIAPKVIVFLMHTGLRFGEVTALKWKNVDIGNRTIKVMDNAPIVKNREESGSKYIIKETTVKRKSSERVIPLSNKAMEIITELFVSKDCKDDDLVFTTRTGKYLDRRNVNRCLSSMLKSANCQVQDASVHDLRHSFGSELIKRGIDVKIVSELLGHKDIQTTYNIYIHILQEQKASAINLFD